MLVVSLYMNIDLCFIITSFTCTAWAFRLCSIVTPQDWREHDSSGTPGVHSCMGDIRYVTSCAGIKGPTSWVMRLAYPTSMGVACVF